MRTDLMSASTLDTTLQPGHQDLSADRKFPRSVAS
jgi:hypothetical protein